MTETNPYDFVLQSLVDCFALPAQNGIFADDYCFLTLIGVTH